MKHYRWIAMAVVLLAGNAFALQSTTELVEQFDGYRLVAFVEERDIESSPEWNPDTDAPPLSVAGAIRAVRDFDKNLGSSNAIVEIDLRPLPDRGNHWHYLVEVRNDAMSNKVSVFVVLMNGKVIPAIIEPRA